MARLLLMAAHQLIVGWPMPLVYNNSGTEECLQQVSDPLDPIFLT